MTDEPDPLLSLTRGIEELLHAAAEAATRARRRLEESRPLPGDRTRGETALHALARELWAALAWGKSHALGALANAVRDEVDRWESRAATDPAAARVRELFRALLEVLEGEEPDLHPPRSSRPQGPASRSEAPEAASASPRR